MKKYIISGGIAGFLNGFMGGGGGALLVPLLMKYCHKSQREALASSVAIILPICLISAILFGLKGDLDINLALPYVIGGGLGGFLGGKLFPKAKQAWLKRGFALLMILSGVRCLV